MATIDIRGDEKELPSLRPKPRYITAKPAPRRPAPQQPQRKSPEELAKERAAQEQAIRQKIAKEQAAQQQQQPNQLRQAAMLPPGTQQVNALDHMARGQALGVNPMSSPMQTQAGRAAPMNALNALVSGKPLTQADQAALDSWTPQHGQGYIKSSRGTGAAFSGEGLVKAPMQKLDSVENYGADPSRDVKVPGLPWGYPTPDGKVVGYRGDGSVWQFDPAAVPAAEQKYAMEQARLKAMPKPDWQILADQGVAVNKNDPSQVVKLSGVQPQDKWKTDTGAGVRVNERTGEVQQLQMPPDQGKVNAARSMDYVSGQMAKQIPETMSGGVFGLKGMAGKVFDSQDAQRFDNLKEQMSTELRTLFRIPGEGSLSDKEQAQYGLQLPSRDYNAETNNAILADVKNRVGLRLAPPQTQFAQPAPQQQQAAQPAAPQVGQVMGGFKFLGGDPSDQSRWLPLNQQQPQPDQQPDQQQQNWWQPQQDQQMWQQPQQVQQPQPQQQYYSAE